MKMDVLSDGTRTIGLDDVPNQRVSVSGNLIAAMTTQQYQDGLYAAIRELVTNAAESHVLANRETQPFDVSLDFPLVGETVIDEDGHKEQDVRQATFTIRDYGVGMAPEFIEDGYYVVGHSTKRENDNVGGAFGLGAKAVFAAAASIRLTSYYNGKRHEYLAGIVDGYIRVKELTVPEPTDEPHGVKISFVFKTHGYQMSKFQVLYGEPDSQFPISFEEQTSLEQLITRYERSLEVNRQPGSDTWKDNEEAQATMRRLKPKRVGLSAEGSSLHVTAFMKALLPVGHPGSTYKTVPSIRVNGLPMVIEDWKRETKTELDMRASALSWDKHDSLVLQARAVYYSESYIAVGELSRPMFSSDDGTLNRYYCLSRVFGKSTEESRLLLWHNAYYAFKLLDGKLREEDRSLIYPPILSTHYRKSNSPYSAITREPVMQIYCIPPSVKLSVTPERTGIRSDDTSHRLIVEYSKLARQQLYRDLATAWWEFFQKTAANLRSVVDEVIAESDAGDDERNLSLEIRQARIQYLGVLEGLWSSMFLPVHTYLPKEVQGEYQSRNVSDYVFRRVFRSTFDKSGEYNYWFASSKQNSIGAISFEDSFIATGEAIKVGSEIERPPRGWPNVQTSRLNWFDWVVADTEDGLKQVQRRETGNAIVVITRDPKFVERLAECLSELGVNVVNGMGAKKPKRIKESAVYRIATLSHNEIKSTSSTQRLHRLNGIADGMYARTIGSSGWLEIGTTGKRISENALLTDIRTYFKDLTYAVHIAVVRLNDPQKTVKLFEDQGLEPWEKVFTRRFDAAYTDWRLETASRKLGHLSQPLTMISNMLEAATGSDDPEKWRKFLGWKKDRFERQLWYRMYVRYLETGRYDTSIPDMNSWAQADYAVDLFNPQTIRRVFRAYKCDLYENAYNRRHGHALPKPDSYRGQAADAFATVISDLVTYREGKSNTKEPLPKMSTRELKFIQEMARAYVENFSQE